MAEHASYPSTFDERSPSSAMPVLQLRSNEPSAEALRSPQSARLLPEEAAKSEAPPTLPAPAADKAKPTLLGRMQAQAGAAAGAAWPAPASGAPPQPPASLKVPKLRLPISDEQDFRNTVEAGRPCTLLEPSGDEDDEYPVLRQEAVYHISRVDRELVLEHSQELCPNRPSIRCPVAGIEDVYQLDDGKECFPRFVQLGATAAEWERLLMVVYVAQPGPDGCCKSEGPNAFCLLEHTREARDCLLKHLKEASFS